MFKKVFVSLTAASLLAANVCFAMDNGGKAGTP